MNEITREDCAAALLLFSWKHHVILDPQTAHELEEEKRLHKHRLQSPPPPPKHLPYFLPVAAPHEIAGERRLPAVAALHGLVGECSPPWEKQLTGSDLLENQRRLLLQQSYVKRHLYPLLSSREVDKLKNVGIVVNVYDREGNIYKMLFKLWGKKAHVLTSGGWLRFSSDLIKEIDWITLWMFKHVHTHQICFAIVSERRPLSTLPTATGNNRKRSRKNDLSILLAGAGDRSSNKKRSRKNDLSFLPAETSNNTKRSKHKE